MGTKEAMEIAFYQDYRSQLPPFLSSIFPYRLAWNLLMGETDTYIGGLEHEAFHAFQGNTAPLRLEQAENANRSESRYPWDDPALAEAWVQEHDLLVQAVRAPDDEQAVDLVRQFLQSRDQRRAAAGLDAELVNYERQREWLEGLAKYAELSIQRLAATASGYIPQVALAVDPDFKGYATRERYWLNQMGEIQRSASREGESRFYYGGMAQAVLLDRLLPGWKGRAFAPGVMLEDLLREAVSLE
jgi:hypothetical protein